MINIPYIKFFLATLATLFLHLNSSVLHAQSYEFQAISTGEPILRTLWYAKDSKKIEIVATALMRSESYKYDLGPNVIFYGERFDEEGKPIAEAIAKLPADATRVLLFFNKLKKPDEFGLNYEVIVLEDDYSNFPFGSFRFINASDKNLAIRISEEQLSLPSGETKIVKVRPSTKDLGIDIATYISEKDKWLRGYSSLWGHRENLRTLVFIANDPNGGIRTLRFRESGEIK
jgi:hypothetical protein